MYGPETPPAPRKSALRSDRWKFPAARPAPLPVLISEVGDRTVNPGLKAAAVGLLVNPVPKIGTVSGRVAPVAIDHPDIAGIDRQGQRLAHHQRPGLLMHRIGQAEQRSDQAAKPEGDGNDAMAFLFAAEPLDQKP